MASGQKIKASKRVQGACTPGKVLHLVEMGFPAIWTTKIGTTQLPKKDHYR